MCKYMNMNLKFFSAFIYFCKKFYALQGFEYATVSVWMIM